MTNLNQDEMYCSKCGSIIKKEAVICTSCGVQHKNVEREEQKQEKSKTTAIVLSLLVGIFSWLYTYKRDAWKFWTSIGITIVSLGVLGIVAWIWVFIDTCVKPKEFFEEYPNY